MLRVILLAFAMLIMVGAVPVQPVQPTQPGIPPPSGGTPPPPSITVNGASGGTTVTAGASMSVAVANGPGNATDWVGVCNAGVPISSTQCDRAGYSWDYLNCTRTAPTVGVTSATCSLSAPSVAGNYYAVFFSNNSYTVLASAPFGVTVPPPSSPSITVNGASGGTAVSAGASISVAVANGPGSATDWMGVCKAGATPAPVQCDGAGYDWDYLNCTQTAPTAGATSATCSLMAPSVNGNYVAYFFTNNGYTAIASASFTVTGGSAGRTLTLTFNPQMPSVQDTVPLGTVIATVTAAWSDGSPFTGTLGFGSPYADDGGTFALSCQSCATANIVVRQTGPGLMDDGGTVQNITVVATQ